MPAIDKRLARRMFGAQNHLERELGRKVTLEELGAEIAKAQDREEPFSPSVVARWLKAAQEPKTRRVWLALAAAMRVDVGWLAFGDATAAKPPADYKEQKEEPATKGDSKVHEGPGVVKRRRAKGA